MEARSSPEDPGKKEGPRWIEGPSATPSQPEDQPQMARPNNNGDVPGTQSTVVSESGDPLLKPRRKKASSFGHCASTIPVISQHSRDKTPRAASTRESPTPMGQGNYEGCSCSIQQLLSKDVEDDARPRVEGNPKAWPAFPSFQTRPITLLPATKNQQSGETTVRPTDVEHKSKPGGPDAVAPRLEVIRISSNPGPDGDYRLRRAFGLLFGHAVKDMQEPLD